MHVAGRGLFNFAGSDVIPFRENNRESCQRALSKRESTKGERASAAVVRNRWAVPGLMIVLDCKVTAPVSDNALPFGAAPVPSEMEAWARMLPLKMEVVPSVAEVPTCQKMLAACAPPCRMNWLPLKVVSALAIWKMKTLLVLP